MILEWNKTLLHTSQVFRVLCTMFNAQGLKVIIIVVLVGTLKIYVTTIKALKNVYIYMKFNLPHKLMVCKFSPLVEC